MGKIVFAGAMSHVLDPDYYQRACGDEGRRMVTDCMTEIARMGERFSATRADALTTTTRSPSTRCRPSACASAGACRA